MKSLVLCACVLIIGSSNSTHPNERSRNEAVTVENDIKTCITENSLTEKDFYRTEDIMVNVHTKSENKERTKNIGCYVTCVFKKQNLMKGSHIKEEEVVAKFDILFNDSSNEMHRVVRKCMEEARNIMEECEKGFSIYACTLRGIHEVAETWRS